MSSLNFLGIFCILHLAVYNLASEESSFSNSVYLDCLKEDPFSCLKYKVFSLVDKVLEQTDVTISDGVKFVKTSEPHLSSSRNNGDLTSVLWDKVRIFFQTHSLKLDLNGKELVETVSSAGRSIGESITYFAEENDDDDEESGKDFDEGRHGNNKIKKLKKVKKIRKFFMSPIMGMLAMNFFYVTKVFLVALVLFALKALFMSKLAFFITAALGSMKLFGGGHRATNFVPVLPPIPVTSHVGHDMDVGHGYGDAIHSGGYSEASWSRSFHPQLAYSAYKPAQ